MTKDNNISVHTPQRYNYFVLCHNATCVYKDNYFGAVKQVINDKCNHCARTQSAAAAK